MSEAVHQAARQANTTEQHLEQQMKKLGGSLAATGRSAKHAAEPAGSYIAGLTNSILQRGQHFVNGAMEMVGSLVARYPWLRNFGLTWFIVSFVPLATWTAFTSGTAVATATAAITGLAMVNAAIGVGSTLVLGGALFVTTITSVIVYFWLFALGVVAAFTRGTFSSIRNMVSKGADEKMRTK